MCRDPADSSTSLGSKMIQAMSNDHKLPMNPIFRGLICVTFCNFHFFSHQLSTINSDSHEMMDQRDIDWRLDCSTSHPAIQVSRGINTFSMLGSAAYLKLRTPNEWTDNIIYYIYILYNTHTHTRTHIYIYIYLQHDI